jgi:23S rRNA (guanine745-N1)-methyltransferase
VTTTSLPPVFACPVCDTSLSRDESTLRCGNGHPFDVAREGYVNLLLAQHRRSKDPGYSKEMIAGRRDFFAAGHYERLADGIAELITAYLPAPGAAQVVIDAGCGEGYYLRRLRHRLAVDGRDEHTVLCGTDISKHGIRMAARHDPAGQYAVASTYRLPVPAGIADVLLTQFSPMSAEDFRRAVKPGGIVLVGGPAPGHLYSFKQLLYETAQRHDPADTLADEPGFTLVEAHPIRYPLAVRGAGQVANLLLMTPYFWSADQATRARLAVLEQLDTEVDVVVHAYRRTPADASVS